jgi:hypothetical protein
MPVAWKSKKQAIAVDSSGASELVAAHFGVRDCLLKVPGTLQLMVDNSAVVRNARRGGANSGLAWLARALRLRMEVLHDLSELGVVHTDYINTKLMKADGLTKAIGPVKIQDIRTLLNVQ